MKEEATVPKQWNDIVFENRNKDYGAYFIRQIYSSNVIIASLITAAIIILVFAYPSIAKWLSSSKDEAPVMVMKQTTISLDQPPPIIPNQPPPPKIDIPPPVKTIIKFLSPKVTDKQVAEEEEMPKMEEVKKVEVGPETQEGTGTVIFNEPVKDEGDAVDPNEVFMVVEQPPEFPGGLKSLYEFIGKNIKYPVVARRMSLEGAVYVSFVVGIDGSITDIQILKGIGGGCDEEAKRVVALLPPWKPGKQRGRAVKVKYTLPMKFTLN